VVELSSVDGRVSGCSGSLQHHPETARHCCGDIGWNSVAVVNAASDDYTNGMKSEQVQIALSQALYTVALLTSLTNGQKDTAMLWLL